MPDHTQTPDPTPAKAPQQIAAEVLEALKQAAQCDFGTSARWVDIQKVT